MPRRVLRAALALALLAPGPGASAEVYRWTDADGRLHFTQDLGEVPPGQREAARGDAASPDGRGTLQTYRAPEPPPRRVPRRGAVLRIPFAREGHAMLVEVRVNDRVTAPFLVDTGASDVAIPRWVADRAGVRIGPDTPRATYLTANGPVRKPVVTLDSVVAGEARVEGVRASISETMDVGLLGGTFFNHFTFQIDPAAQVISAVPNERSRGGLSARQWRERFQTARGRLAELDRYLSDNHFVRESRVAELERHREALQEQLEALEEEADRADVPQGWRE